MYCKINVINYNSLLQHIYFFFSENHCSDQFTDDNIYISAAVIWNFYGKEGTIENNKFTNLLNTAVLF